MGGSWRATGDVDESTITGEAMPVEKRRAAVHEATVNLHGVLTMEVTRALAESTVAQMIALVTQAQAMKAPSERFSDWFGERYTVAVLVGQCGVCRVVGLGLDAGRGDVPGGDGVGGGQPLRGGDLGSRGDPVGAVGGGAGRGVVQGRGGVGSWPRCGPLPLTRPAL